MLITTVETWTMVVGRTMPVPRKAAAIIKTANCRGIALAADEIQVDQPAQHHHDHAGENLRRHRRYVAHDRALGEVLHVASGCARAQAGSVVRRAAARPDASVVETGVVEYLR